MNAALGLRADFFFAAFLAAFFGAAFLAAFLAFFAMIFFVLFLLIPNGAPKICGKTFSQTLFSEWLISSRENQRKQRFRGESAMPEQFHFCAFFSSAFFSNEISFFLHHEAVFSLEKLFFMKIIFFAHPLEPLILLGCRGSNVFSLGKAGFETRISFFSLEKRYCVKFLRENQR
jgi:hypothetical protein